MATVVVLEHFPLFLLLSFFKLFPLYLTSQIRVFSRIPSIHLTLNSLLGPAILPWVSPQVFTAGSLVLLRHLHIFWQSQINHLNSVLCFKTSFFLTFLHSSHHALLVSYNSNGAEIRQILGHILALLMLAVRPWGTQKVKVLVVQSCLTLCDPMDCNSPGFFSVHGILQARILEWVTISFSRRSS